MFNLSIVDKLVKALEKYTENNKEFLENLLANAINKAIKNKKVKSTFEIKDES